MKKEVLKVYSWAKGSQIRLDAQEAGKELEELSQAEGELRPQHVVDKASDPKSALHGYFEWDEEKAACKYLLVQARKIIGSLRVEYREIQEGEPSQTVGEVKAFESLSGKGISDNSDSRYYPIEAIVSDADRRNQLKRKLLNRYMSDRQKYSHFKEFDEIWNAVDKVVEKEMQAVN